MSDFKRRNRSSIRLPGYDYTQPGTYFLTLCTQNRECVFDEVREGEMHLNPAGEIVKEEWLNTARVRPHITLDAFVVTPNHIHGIIMMGKPLVGATRRVAPTRGPVSGSVGAIIGQFKSITTKRLSALKNPFEGAIWQRNYYEHIVRHEDALRRIRGYIFLNPQKWKKDRENPSFF